MPDTDPMDVDFALIGETRSSCAEVVDHVMKTRFGSYWATYSAPMSVYYVMQVTRTHGDWWWKGLLPESLFRRIVLPSHSHSAEGGEPIFPDGTPVGEIPRHYRHLETDLAQRCFEAILSLKEQIAAEGFTVPVILGASGASLRHVDGLHRLAALAMLLDDGYGYRPIPVFLCRAGNAVTAPPAA